MNNKGLLYEKLAEKFLTKHGLTPLAQNYRSKLGEIDLIMKDGDTIVFVEVRYRKSSIFGAPSETITRAKQQRIIKTALIYIKHKKLWDFNFRFDVIGISKTSMPLTKQRIDWIKAAFNLEEHE